MAYAVKNLLPVVYRNPCVSVLADFTLSKIAAEPSNRNTLYVTFSNSIRHLVIYRDQCFAYMKFKINYKEIMMV